MIAFGDTRLPDRFWSKVEPVESGCWEWRASRDGAGYGRFAVLMPAGWRAAPAHRIALGALVAPVPPDMHTDHLCRNPPCVNPEHLEAVSPGENVRRGLAGATVAARQLSKTQCKNGHEFSVENTGRIAAQNGARYCRTCHLDSKRRWNAKQKEHRAEKRRALSG